MVLESFLCWMYIFMNIIEWNNEIIRNWIFYLGKWDIDMFYIVVFENEYKNSNRKLEWYFVLNFQGNNFYYLVEEYCSSRNFFIKDFFFFNRNCFVEESIMEEKYNVFGKV